MAETVLADPPALLARSLTELREQHVALLALWRDEPVEGDGKAARAEALHDAAVALGAWLEDEDERIVAQGVLDYWASALDRLRGEATVAPALLRPFDAEAASRRAAEAAALVAAGGNPGVDAADAIILRLLRVDQAGRIVTNPPIPRAELVGADGAHDAVTAALADALMAADILRLRAAPDPDAEAVEFASRGVARRWPRAGEVLTERKRADTTRDRLRATAQLWKQKQEPGYLLGGASLEQAKEFLGDGAEDEVLRDFLDASVARGKRRRKTLIAAIAIGPTLLALTLIGISKLGYDVGFSGGENKALEASQQNVDATREMRNEETELPVQQTQQLALPRAGWQGPEGYVWIGSPSEPMLVGLESDSTVSPETVRAGQTYRANLALNMHVRSALPDANNRPASILSVAPSRSRLLVLATPPPIPRASGQQYWARVRVLPRIFIQYSGSNVGAIRALEVALRGARYEGRPVYDVRDSQQVPDAGGAPSRVRFYFEQDRATAEVVTRVAARALGNTDGLPVATSCDLFVTNSGVLPTTIEIWVNSDALTGPKAPLTAGQQHSCQ
jgi:hypothetical protein